MRTPSFAKPAIFTCSNSTFHPLSSILPYLNQHPKDWQARWYLLLVSVLVAVLAGSSAALFLWGLDQLTDYRNHNKQLIYFLPLAGLLVGWLYQRLGSLAQGGNNQILDEFHFRRGGVPFIMAPLVLAGTWLTHAFGASAGREGTAVQMGAALAHALAEKLKLSRRNRRALLLMGMAGGFGAVFGTPLAGAVFAIEVLGKGKQRYRHLLPALLTAWGAHLVCLAWGIQHTPFALHQALRVNLASLPALLAAALAFGLAARLFSTMGHFFSRQFARFIPALPLRAFTGGMVLSLVFWLSQNDRYLGLGVPVILEAFDQPLPLYDFIAKTLYTTFTLGAGFKGGEVTPLFFTGATLGSSLSAYLPLPTDWLAALGLIAVFAGASNTPIACAIMGAELFGWMLFPVALPVCWLAVFVSGRAGIYSSQPAHRFKIEQHLQRSKSVIVPKNS